MSGIPAESVQPNWGKPTPERPYGRFKSAASRQRALEKLLTARDPSLRWRGKIDIPPRACRAVKHNFKEMNNQRATYEDVAKRAGVNIATIKSWRHGTVPNWENIVAVVGALGGKVNIRFHDAIDSFGGRDE